MAHYVPRISFVNHSGLRFLGPSAKLLTKTCINSCVLTIKIGEWVLHCNMGLCCEKIFVLLASLCDVGAGDVSVTKRVCSPEGSHERCFGQSYRSASWELG